MKIWLIKTNMCLYVQFVNIHKAFVDKILTNCEYHLHKRAYTHKVSKGQNFPLPGLIWLIVAQILHPLTQFKNLIKTRTGICSSQRAYTPYPNWRITLANSSGYRTQQKYMVHKNCIYADINRTWFVTVTQRYAS